MIQILGLAAKAITTTDTFPKTHSEFFFEKRNIIINGIAKGSGMIAPNMATMLAFLFLQTLTLKKRNVWKNFERLLIKLLTQLA